MKIHNPPTVAPGAGYSHGIELPPNTRILYCAGQLGLKADGSFASTRSAARRSRLGTISAPCCAPPVWAMRISSS